MEIQSDFTWDYAACILMCTFPGARADLVIDKNKMFDVLKYIHLISA